MAVPPYVEGDDETGHRRQPVDAARLWTGGLATAVVAALVALVGVLIARGLTVAGVRAKDDCADDCAGLLPEICQKLRYT